MVLDLYRYSSQSVTTFGALMIDGKFHSHTVEDRHRDEKVMHKTRISAGTYTIKLREFGSHYEKYKVKYEGHKGMLWLQDVPEFTDILIHIGNDAGDTSGCILINTQVNNNRVDSGKGQRSTEAYLDMYFKVLEAFERGEAVTIKIHDLDIPYGK
jgi:hypothetical protein